MPLIYPVLPAQFFDLLGIQSSTFYLPGDNSPSITGGGDVIAHRRGARLWQGEVVLDKSQHSDIASQDALIADLSEPGASFFIYDRRQSPLAGAPGLTPVIDSLNVNNRELSLSALPPNLGLPRGTFLGWAYLSNPTRYALHQIVSDGVTADGAGLTPQFLVRPFIRTGVVTGTGVSLERPVCKAKMLTVKPSEGRSGRSLGGSFTWMQTLR